jgi:hypothetical protein
MANKEWHVIHPHTELRFATPEIGYGVFATQVIPCGTITWVRDEIDQTLSAARVADTTGLLREMFDRYGYIDGRGDALDKPMKHARARVADHEAGVLRDKLL